jgi:hypothetical protein
MFDFTIDTSELDFPGIALHMPEVFRAPTFPMTCFTWVMLLETANQQVRQITRFQT